MLSARARSRLQIVGLGVLVSAWVARHMTSPWVSNFLSFVCFGIFACAFAYELQRGMRVGILELRGARASRSSSPFCFYAIAATYAFILVLWGGAAMYLLIELLQAR